MKLLTAILIALALTVAGCGGDDEGDEPASTQEPATTTAAKPPAEPSSDGDEVEAVEDTVKKWLLEGGCERMTDKFLEEQLLGLGDNRKERCDLFQKQHTKPQYSEDQIEITQAQVSGNRASLVVGSENAPDITSKYELVKQGSQWRIDSAELE